MYTLKHGTKDQSLKRWILFILITSIAFISLFANNCWLLFKITGDS